jgi:hypothetical protein
MKNLLIFVFTLCTMMAFGQQSETTVDRQGFVIGLGVSGGVISISDSNQENAFDEAQGAFSLPNLKMGWMVHDRLAIMATTPGMIYEFEGKDRSFGSIIPSVQYWIKDKWWVNGGIGLATDFPALYEDLDDEDWHFGCAVAASTGYEFYQKDNFAIDLQAQLHLGRVFMDNDIDRDGVAFSVGVGFNWY